MDIPLNMIWFNESMSKLVNVSNSQKRKTGTVGKLTRMNQFKNKEQINEPIVVRLVNGKYEVINGRHRVVHSFLRKNKSIKAKYKMNYTFRNNWEINKPPSPEYGTNYNKKLENWVNKFQGNNITRLLNQVNHELTREKISKIIKKKKAKKPKKLPTNITLEELLSQVKIK